MQNALASSQIQTFPLLTPEILQQIHLLLAKAHYIDGRATASDAAKAVKNNLQIDMSDKTVLPVLQQLMGQAVVTDQRFHQVFYAATAYPFMFSRCEVGMGYGKHVDSPIMGNPPIRTDLAMTIFLDDPASYDGGELVINTGDREIVYKPAAGDAVVYPCQYIHHVNPVTRGVRNVCVTWFQSTVRSAEHRQALANLMHVYNQLAAKDPQSDEARILQQTWSNLLRLWADI